MLITAENRERGFSLLEVLLCLVVSGVMAGLILKLYAEQYRLSSEVLVRAELRYSLLKAGQVLTKAVREGDSVEWVNDSVLVVRHRQSGQPVTDYFYLADKDFDGIIDLYRERLGVPNPVAGRLSAMSCCQVGNGLWEIRLSAVQGNTVVLWEKKVRQRLWK